MRIFIASSWKNKDQVFKLAKLLENAGHSVYNFADFSKRTAAPIDEEELNSSFHSMNFTGKGYRNFISQIKYTDIINENRKAINECHLLILLLPCGLDANIDWAYAVGKGKPTILCGVPYIGSRCLNHQFADVIISNMDDIMLAIDKIKNNYAAITSLAVPTTNNKVEIHVSCSNFDEYGGKDG
jgi:hypothetical protein